MDYSNPLTQPDVERYVRSVAARADLHVSWHTGTDVFTTAKTLHLPVMRFPLTDEGVKTTLAQAEHEVSHVIHSDFQILTDNNVNMATSWLGAIFNMVEDHRIEYLPSMDYIGTRDVLNWYVGECVPGCVKGVTEATEKREYADKVGAMMDWDMRIREDWQSAAIGADFIPALGKSGKEYRAKFEAHPELAEKMRDIRSQPGHAGCARAWELAKEIFEKVYGGNVEQELEEQKKRAAEAKAGSGKPEDGPEGKGKAAGAGAEDGEGEGEVQQMDEISYTPRHSTVRKPPARGEAPRRVKLSYDSAEYVPARSDEVRVAYLSRPHLSTLSLTERHGSYSTAHHLKELKALDVTGSAVFANKVRTLLQVKSQKHYTYGHKSGKLHGASLHRVEADVAGYSERVFRQKHQQLTLDTSVCVAVDMSGSMSGSKVAHAGVAAALLSTSLGNLLRIPVMVFGFSGHDTPEHVVFRDFTDKIIPHDKFLERFTVGMTNLMSQNLDGESIVWGYQALTSQRSKRKVMIVLSDGAPAANRDGDSDKYLKSVTGNIEACKRVDLYGIGLMTDSVKRYYKDHSIITDASDLERALLTVIQRKIV
jgi:Mg-chelatase subunit ChlD